MNQLGHLIREKRKEKGISQQTLGSRVDYARQHILNIEAGRLSPPDDLLDRIAKELDVPYGRLIALKMLEKANNEVKYWLQIELQTQSQELPLPPESL